MGKNNSGINLISLIITIISIIIIAAITMFSGFGTPKMANFSRFTEEINNIRVSVANLRAENLANYDDSNYAFSKVTIENAPDSFSSCSDNGAEITGYLVNFDILDYNVNSYGQQEINDGKVVFEEDDVFVFDSKGIIYYALGFEHEDKLYFNAKTYRKLEVEK